MAEPSDNPYAPPSAEFGSIVAEPLQSWSVEGDYLMVRPDAQLPPVALQGQGTWLTPGARRFAVLAGGKGWAVAFIPTLLLGAWVVYSHNALDGRYLWYGFIAIFFVSRFLLGRAGSASTVQATLKGFFPVEILRARARRQRWVKYLIFSGLAVMCLGIGILTTDSGMSLVGLGRGFGDVHVTWMFWTMGTSLLLTISALFVNAFTPQLRATGYRDGWIYLRGVPRETLAILAAKARQGPPPLRKRRVARFYQYRLPLSFLLHRNWLNPWLLFWLTFFKLTRSKNLIRLRFVDREQQPLREADPELQRRWEEGSRGTPLAAWSEVNRDCQDSPQGDMRILGLTHGDPDGRIYCTLIAVRLSVLNAFAESYQSSFQSWTEDGRLITTTSPPRAFATPPHIDSHMVSGSLETIYRAHLARIAGLPVVRIRDKDQYDQLNGRDVELLNEFYEAAGYQSAPEEIDWRDVAG